MAWVDDSTSVSDEPEFVLSRSTSPQPNVDDRFYRYERLEPYKIRVIRILPSEEGTLRLQLLVNSLRFFRYNPWKDITDSYPDSSDCSEYTAVSYTWGDQADRKDIYVNGKILSIGANCYNTIKQLMPYRHKHQAFWIDAICIDQSSLAEKNEQVQIMAEIFRQAESVLSCIGPHADDSKFLCKVIKQFHEKSILVRDRTPRLLFDLMKLDSKDYYTEKVNSRGSLVLSLESARRAYRALQAFATRPYFKRLWIVQELTVAQEVVIACGDDLVALHQLKNFCCYLSFKRFNQLFGTGFQLPDCIVQKISATHAAHSDILFDAMWIIEGPIVFARAELNALPMLVALQTRDAYQREDVAERSYSIFGATDPVILDARKIVVRDDYEASNTPYLALVERLQEWGCSEVRDMLFGLTNISWLPSWCPNDMKPRADYSQSVLSVAMEAVRLADYVDEYDTEHLLDRIALICKVFRLDFNHPDIVAARLRRRNRSMANLDDTDAGTWAQKYDIPLPEGAFMMPLKKSEGQTGGLGADQHAARKFLDDEQVVAGEHVKDTDYLIELPIGLHMLQDSATYQSIWLVMRDERDLGLERKVIGQAFVSPRRPLEKIPRKRPQGCTLDLEDLIVLFCQLKRWDELTQKQCLLESDLAFLNQNICRTEHSTWLS